MSDNEEIFKEFGKKIPKGSYVIIIRDQPNGATDFMCYDSTDKKEDDNVIQFEFQPEGKDD